MPTKRRRVTRNLVSPVSAVMLAYFRTGEHPTAGEGDWSELYTKSDAEILADWLAVRDQLLAAWLQESPGTRPSGWWTFDAPRWRREDQPARVQPITALDCAEPRRRVGGIGTPSYEVLNVWPVFDHGIPSAWVTAFDEAYYNGRATDVCGAPIGVEFRAGHFRGLAPRADDLPTFESQAAYLDRHGLLTAAERGRLPADAFHPEVLVLEADEGIDVRAKFPVFDKKMFDETAPEPDSETSERIH